MYKRVFKCRLCGEIFSGKYDNKEFDDICHAARDMGKLKAGLMFGDRLPTELHECSDGGFGLGDFVGHHKDK